jgi:hypothetical protein
MKKNKKEKKPKWKDTEKKVNIYLEQIKILNKELYKEEEKLEDLLVPQSIKEEEKKLQLLLDITSKFQTLHENTETIRKNSLNIFNIPEIEYPETKGQNKIHSLSRENWKLIRDIIAINDSLLESFKIILEDSKIKEY